jgi:hypothetical protein
LTRKIPPAKIKPSQDNPIAEVAMRVSGRFQLILFSFFVLCFLAVSTVSASDRFKKMDTQSNELPDDAEEWAIVFDTKYGLYWEVKSADESLHSNEGTYTFTNVGDNFIVKINADKFGGYSDWRLPTTSELGTLRKRKKDSPEAHIDLQYFPGTLPSKYMSQGWCGSRSEYQEESVKFGKKKVKGAKYVRLVRGQPLE